jgi:2-amino-4-hydroxy-6-hydroxymethyldihydropteridine diphosphokinase
VAIIYVGMGSNLGFRRFHLGQGLRHLKEIGALTNVSDILQTDPVGPQDQPLFLNLVAEIVSDYSPFTLLRRVKHIERIIGRRPTYRWGPRVLDLDLLLYDGLHLQTPTLILPHPRMAEREFVMKPLAQIAPEIAAKIRSQNTGVRSQ